MKLRRITLRLDPEDYSKLDALRGSRSISQLIREILSQYLESKEASQGSSQAAESSSGAARSDAQKMLIQQLSSRVESLEAQLEYFRNENSELRRLLDQQQRLHAALLDRIPKLPPSRSIWDRIRFWRG